MKQLFVLVFFLTIISCKKNYTHKDLIKEDVAFLADDALKGRATGTEGELTAAKYIADRFKEMGVDPKGTDGYFQKFTFLPKTDPHKDTEYVTMNSDSTITGTNVIGYIDNNAEETIIIGAHFDHLGLGGDGSLHRGDTDIHNGADDNASGTAVMINLASRLKGKNTNNNFLFMAFSGEEMGLLGSNYFVKNPTIDTKAVNYMINMDMVGRLKEDKTIAVYGVGTSPRFSQTLNSLKGDFNLVEKESGVGPSDHTSFYLSDIPVLHFFTGQHEDYHKPSDDFDKLNYEGMYAISDYIFNVISELNESEKLAFRKTKNESEEVPRFKVGLGVVPDYLYSGKGMRIDGTREDTPAVKAGLKKGDVVLKLGEHEVTDMMSYMKALSTFEKGNTTKIVIERNGEKIEADLTF
ncbi:MAG: M28 family peptidase [Flavobacteriaceae bacterium]|nr:M28 family peptidase [Flavobacteriaceae bacterium]